MNEDHDLSCPLRHRKSLRNGDQCQCVVCVCKDYRPINRHGECGNCHRVPINELRDKKEGSRP